MNSLFNSFLGGSLIGVAVTLMLLFNGRVTGISGIISSSLTKPSSDIHWRWLFILGLVFGGFVMNSIRPDFFNNLTERSSLVILAAGFIVGYGTVMGSGCTSGHGVCGISRLSMRSLVATITFMLFGFLSVALMHGLIGD